MALGPLVYLRRSWHWALVLLVLCAILTLLTQVGGVVLWLSTPFLASAAQRLRKWGKAAAALETVTIFLLIYGLASLLVVPPLAALGGRVPLPCFSVSGAPLQARSVLYCAFNRHYVRRDLGVLAENMAVTIGRAYPGARFRYLDAGFPFVDGFPLLPHLSHRYGTAIDLALFYRDGDGRPASSPSPLGYWVYVGPRPGEVRPCGGRLSRLRWDMGWIQHLGNDVTLDGPLTRDVLRWLSQQPNMDRIFIEPHLRERMRLDGATIRFQGCGAARHDDHIHIQIKR